MKRTKLEPPHPSGYWTVQEVADLLRISRMTAYRLIKSGELTGVQFGRSYRVKNDVLEAYINNSEAQKKS